MRSPDPTRFLGRAARRPDKLQMKGFSVPLLDEPELQPDVSDEVKTPPLDGFVHSTTQPQPEITKRTSVPTDERTYERTGVRKEKRVKIRHAFDIFEDQLRELQLLQLEDVRSGNKKRKLGEMVQEAIELYLERQKRKREKQR